MELIVNPIWSWPWVVLAALGLLGMVLATYPSRVRHLPAVPRRLLLGLRLAAVALLALAMVRPAVQLRHTDANSSVLMVLADKSRSMMTQDAPGRQSRRAAVLQTLADCRDQFETLSKDIEVRYYDFAETINPVEHPSQQPDGEQTALGEALDEVLEETRTSQVAGVLLLSDGAQRAVPPFDTDPRRVARQLGQQQIPVYTVGIGGSALSGSSLDLSVEDLLVDPLVFEKKAVPVTAKVRALGAAGRELTVRLLVEDRSGQRPGEAGAMSVPPTVKNAKPVTRIQPTQNEEVLPVELSYVPQFPGEFKIRFEVEPVEGELKTSNNAQETIITVQRGGISVAYFDTIRPEQHFLRLVNTSEKIQLDYQPIRGGRFADRTTIDPAMFEPGRYDAYIIGDVPADVFGPNRLRELAARVEEGAGLLMIGGYHSFGPGGYAATPLADLLPVAMSPVEIQRGEQIATDLHHLRPLKMVPTDTGLKQFVMRLDNDPVKNRERWASLAPLEGANKLRRKNDFVQVLAESPDGVGLLFVQEAGRARVAAFAADTTYQWVLAGQAEAHQRFWRQMILWLCRKEYEGNQPVWVRVDPRNYVPKQRVGLTFGARDDKGQPVPDAQFTVKVIGPNSQTQQLESRESRVQSRETEPQLGPAPGSGLSEHTAEFSDTQQPGDYWVQVSAEKNGESLGFDAWTRFIVDARDLELDNPAADTDLLKELAALTGGTFMPAEQLKSFLQRKLEEGGFTPGNLTQVRRITLWDNWPFLLAFVALMSTEWFLRKRRGLV